MASDDEPADGQAGEEEHRRQAEEMHGRWLAGEAKSQLEIAYWNDATSHGKRFTAYVRRWLGVETERRSEQTERIRRLEALLRVNGIAPTDAGDLAEEHRLVAKARESALAAVRVYNDPAAGFRSETFIVLMVIAWNSLFQAILERDGVDYYVRDPAGRQVLIDGRAKVLDTGELAARALAGDALLSKRGVRANLDFFLGLRNQIAHRYLPALDLEVTAEAQAMLLNFENLVVAEFGDEAALGDRLTVPLQLSGFRDKAALASLHTAQAQLPVDVQAYLRRHREEVDDDVLRSSEYAMPIFFVPVAANRERSADAVVRFIRPGAITPEVEEALEQLAVVTKPKRVPVASADLLRPTEVVNLVSERPPFRFTLDTHQRAWKYYVVRPATDSAEPEATDERYCRWDRLSRGYGYTRAWVDKLVEELSDPLVYERIAGFEPEKK
jgi:hypothetical protein